MQFKQSPFILSLSFIANGLAYSFFVITLPTVGRELEFSDTNTGLILAVSALMITLASPVWGYICDRWGRRKVIIIGISATTLFTILSAIIIQLRLDNSLSVDNTFFLLLIARLFNSIFTGGLKPAGQAYIADVTSSSDRAKGMGMMGAAFGIGAIMGGITAMLSGSEQLWVGYTFISIILVLSSILSLFYLSDTTYTQTIIDKKNGSRLPYANIWVFLLITFVGLSVFSLLQHIVGLTLQDKFTFSIDRSVRFSGMIMMVTMLTMIITQLFIVRRLNFKPRKLIVSGLSIALISMCFASLLIIANTPYSISLLVFSMALFGLGLGLLLPGNLACLSMTVDRFSQARAAGINGVSQGIALSVGPILGLTLHKLSFTAPFLSCALLLTLLLLLFSLINKEAGYFKKEADVKTSR
ncbi:MAG: MFS transporter [Cellvibrionaceae bacterium]